MYELIAVPPTSCNFVGYCRSFSNCLVLCFLCVLCPCVYTLHVFIIELYFIFSAYTPLFACHQSCHVTLFSHSSYMHGVFECPVVAQCGGPMSPYKHPRQLLTLTRSCTDRSTGTSSTFSPEFSRSRYMYTYQ